MCVSEREGGREGGREGWREGGREGGGGERESDRDVCQEKTFVCE